MAIVRCREHGVRHAGEGHFTHDYIRGVPALGGDMTAAICGRPSCERPGTIWLEKHESDAYDRGTRVFDLLRNRAKVRAADPLN